MTSPVECADDDVQITPAIQALAKQLDHNPVEIYNWVHNNIEYLPTYGSIQGSDMMLQTLRGNDFDTASLLIALLRASNIPARYVYGTIQVPIAEVENWVGGVTDPNAALNLLGQGGVPVTGLAQGGQIIAAQMEHVWVEAWVNFIPSRGAKAGPGNTWIPMDASFKLYTYTQGMNLQQAVPFDANAFIQKATANSTINDAAGSIEGLNTSAIQASLSSYETQLTNYVDGEKPGATNADVYGSRAINVISSNILSASLPYRTNIIAARFAEIPGNLRYQIQFNLYDSPTSEATDSPSFTFSKDLPAIAGQKISFTYPAASANDQALIDSANDGLATGLPAYLINVVPTLSIEGNVVASGPATQMGSQQILTVTVVSPADQESHDYTTDAGDFDVLVVNPAGITSSLFQARTAAHELSQLSDADLVGESYYQIGLGWWAENYARNRLYALDDHVVEYQLPSYTMVGTSLAVTYNFGIPQSAVYNARFIDVKQDKLAVESVAGDGASAFHFMELAGGPGSSLESGIFDQMYVMDAGHSISTMELLKIANDENIPIYTITSSNIDAAIPV